MSPSWNGTVHDVNGPPLIGDPSRSVAVVLNRHVWTVPTGELIDTSDSGGPVSSNPRTRECRGVPRDEPALARNTTTSRHASI